MSYVRRLAAIVLLLSIVPSLVLGGVPVMYCADKAGHQALEVVLEGVAHGGEHSVPRNASSLQGSGRQAVVVFENNGCTDTALMDVAAAPVTQEVKFLPLPLPAGQLPRDAAAQPVIPAVSPQGAMASRLDPRMDARRTMVLRI